MRNVPVGYEPFPTVRKPAVFVTFQKQSVAIPKSKVTISTATNILVGQISDAIDGNTEIPAKYATLERYGWNLDGSCTIMPESGSERGVWFNKRSQADGTFSSSVSVTCILPQETETLGWTFHFDLPTGIYCPEVRAVCYNVQDEEVDDYTGELIDGTERGEGWQLFHTVAQYKKVVFTFSRLNEGYRWFRLAEIDFGITRSFTNNSIISMSLSYSLTLDGSALPSKKLVFEFDNSSREFNILNPVEVFLFWRARQLISADINLGGVLVNMGQFYISRAEIGKNSLTAKVTAYDEVLLFGEDLFDPGSLAESATVTLETAVAAILDGFEFGFDCNGLEDEPVSIQIEATHEKREVLTLVAQAARATVWIDRDGNVQIARPEIKAAEDAELTGNALYDWRGIDLEEEVDGVILTVNRELGGDSETYEAGRNGVGDNSVSYSNPCVAASKGQDVAEWLFAIANWSKKYFVKNRCDPAVELGDTLKIADAFGNNENAFVTGIDVSYNGTLSSTTKAAGEFNAGS